MRFCVALDEGAQTAELDKVPLGDRFSAGIVPGGIEFYDVTPRGKPAHCAGRRRLLVHLGLVRIDLGKAILNRVEEAFCLIRLDIARC